MHIRMTSDGMGQIGLTGSLVSNMEVGARSDKRKSCVTIYLFSAQLTLNFQTLIVAFYHYDIIDILRANAHITTVVSSI